MFGLNLGATGSRGIEEQPDLGSAVQSLTLSKKQKGLFTIDDINENISTYTYTGKELLSDLKIVRYAITNYRMPVFLPSSSSSSTSSSSSSMSTADNQFQQGQLITLENEIFRLAIDALQTSMSAKGAIEAPVKRFQNNVILLDIFATVEDKISHNFRLKEDVKRKGFAETHTICFWKKTDTQFMIIDPSSSKFSERLKNAVQLSLREGQGVDIVEHPDEKFYEAPENSTFDEKAVGNDKPRDCVDIALKIGIVLNEGILSYGNISEIQYSINLLSNQSAVNPVLGKTNNNTLFKRLQSTQHFRRSTAIATFSFIPSVFKEFFGYSAWEVFIGFDDGKQAAILKALTIFNKEIASSNFFADRRPTLKGADTNTIPVHKEEERKIAINQFERVMRLSTFCDRFTSLRRDLSADGEISCEISLSKLKTVLKK